ncbi:MAG: LacI family DNA-binding transcriptional regulator [Armatimonadota bacterium]
MRRRAVTLRDVAEEAGVSVSTVSRVLRGEPGWIGENTASAVREAAERLGYHRDLRARSLRTGTSDLVGVIGAHLREDVAAMMVDEISHYVCENGLRSAFYSASEDPDREADLVRELISLRAVGIIVISYFSPDLGDALQSAIDHGIAVVSLEVPIPPGVDGVAIDYHASMRLAVEHLTDLGHREIGLLTIDSGVQSVHHRTLAWQEGLEEVGAVADEDLIEIARPSLEGGYEGMQRLLSRRPSLTAVASMSDRLAYGALAAAHNMGRKVPEDLSLTGFDDLHYSAFTQPPLSTVRIPWAEIARDGVQLLYSRIEARVEEPQVTRKVGEFVARSSTAAV